MTRDNLKLLKEVHRELWEIREKTENNEIKYRILGVMDKLHEIIEDYKELET